VVEADQRFWHPFTAFGMAEEMVSHLLCQATCFHLSLPRLSPALARKIRWDLMHAEGKR
jgi:hypothetical protein